MARKILLADDSVTAQNMGRKILADAGYQVITVNNGSAALKKIAEVKPDLIVLDVYMPGYSGLEVCQRLKENQETARTPVLLTVGKLEPFKPEEAKRVRAEGFIVKPFEASELLSALSKLEDKVVPRTESSKPGRFARAIAAVDESGRSGRNAQSDEDSGWKNRIAFPSKKKETTEQEDGTDPAIYNAVNRDLRTVVDQPPARQESDDAALATSGMPKDISAEEIAAIAAAAAQVQTITESTPEFSETTSSDRADRAAESQAAPNFQEELASEQQVESQAGSPGAVPAESMAAVQRREDRSETTRAIAPQSEMIAAVAALAPGNGNSSSSDSPALGDGHSTEEIPVTMAAGPAVGEGVESRWIAIPVATNQDEAGVCLELEMQKAYAAFAAAEANSPGFVSSIPEAFSPADAVVSPVMEAATVTQDAIVSAPSTVPEPESVAPSFVPETANVTEAVAAFAETIGGDAAQPAEVAASYTDASAVSADGGEIARTTAEIAPPEPFATPSLQVDEPTQVADTPIQPFEDGASQESVAQKTGDDAAIAAGAVAASGESATGGVADNSESELAASTAAAWASWRQIRETSQPQITTEDGNQRALDADEPLSPAAMAVAAGAEKTPDALLADSSDPTAIASIVDSVLADLRPRIVEEISRKLGKRK